MPLFDDYEFVRKTPTYYVKSPGVYSRFWIGILSVVFTAVVGAFLLADNYVMIEDRRKAFVLRVSFLGGTLVWWFSLTAISLLISPTSDSIVVSVVTTLLAWFAPLLPLMLEYRRWLDQLRMKPAIRKGPGGGPYYSVMMIVVLFFYNNIAPPIAAKAILGTPYYTPSFTTFVDGSFSMSYPDYWAKTQGTANPSCYDTDFECVENFILPSYGLLSIARINKQDFSLPMANLEEFTWDNIDYSKKTSVSVFETTLDGFETIQRNFTLENKGKKGEGIIIVSITDREIYVIVGASDKENFFQIEDAIATIQLEQLPNSQ